MITLTYPLRPVAGARAGAGRGPDWRDSAACRGANDDSFFPNSSNTTAVEAAKAVCRGCPVVAECLTWATSNHMDDGVWGGLDPDERRIQARRTGSIANREAVRDGELLAVERGAEFLEARSRSAADLDLMRRFQVPRAAVWQAIRLLTPGELPQRSPSVSTALERVMYRVVQLRRLVAFRLSVGEMAQALDTHQHVIRDALKVLAHVDAFEERRAGTGAAA